MTMKEVRKKNLKRKNLPKQHVEAIGEGAASVALAASSDSAFSAPSASDAESVSAIQLAGALDGTRAKDGYRSFIFDMGGAIQRSGVAIEGAAEMLRSLQERSVPFIILTNEDRYTTATLLSYLHAMLDGVRLKEDHLFTASDSVRLFFTRMLSRGWRGSIFVIGEEGLLANLREAFKAYGNAGAHVLTLKDPEADGMSPVEYIVAGSIYSNTPAGRGYVASLERACAYALAGAKVVSSCPDDYEVCENGKVKLGSPGPTVDVLQKVTGAGSYPLGKPNPHMLQAAWERMVEHYKPNVVDLHHTSALFVGDSLETDIRTSLEHGIDCALVLTGTTTQDKLDRSPLSPTFVFNGIADVHRSYLKGELRPNWKPG